MANALAQDDLIKEVESLEDPKEAIVAFLLGVASRIEDVKYAKVDILRDYAKRLRDGSDQVTKAVLANTDLPKTAQK